MIRVIYRYEETCFDGSRSTLCIYECPSRADADAAALRLGWTPPRWWQWWRWRDEPRRVEVA
jgi:hypothetical protein